MLVTIAAAAAAVALAPVERPAVPVALIPATPDARPTTVCKGEARMQRAAHEKAIYRPSANDRAKRLIEMPMAQGCLLGGSR